jgi:uncharacterized membrane protein HdeD (DUF308 family)
MKLWMKWMVLGVLSLLFGVFVLANPVAASLAVTMLAGIIFALMGAAQAYAGWSAADTMSKAMGLGLGILMLLLGISLIFRPLEGILSLATIATVLIGLNGLMRLYTGYQMKATPMFWPMLLSGALSVLLAGYIVANFFEIAPQLLGILLGIELLFNGAGLIALAIFLRTVRGALQEKLERKFNK